MPASQSGPSTLLGAAHHASGEWPRADAASLPRVAAVPLVPDQDASQAPSLLRRVPRAERAVLMGFGLVALAVTALHGRIDCRSDPFPLTFGADTAVAMTVKAGHHCAVTARPTNAVISHLEIDGPPAHGRLKRRGRTGVVYLVDTNYRGEDSFAFALSGSAPGSRGTALVRVRVTVR
jgi:hypothetical protein